MSVEQIEQSVLRLGADERRRFLDWLDDHRHELIGPRDVATAQQEEVLLRLQECEASPDQLQPFEEADLDRMIRDATHARSQKAPARRG
jgi:hypothetical protein